MKVTLDPQATAALKALMERMRGIKPEIVKSRSVAVNRLISYFTANASESEISALSVRMVSHKARQKNILEQIAIRLAKSDSETALKLLEKTLCRLQQSAKEEPKTAEKSNKSEADFDALAGKS